METATDISSENVDVGAKTTETVPHITEEQSNPNPTISHTEPHSEMEPQSVNETKGAVTHEENSNVEKPQDLATNHQDNGPAAVSHGQGIHPEVSQQSNEPDIKHDQVTNIETSQQDNEPAAIHDQAIHTDTSLQGNGPAVAHDEAENLGSVQQDNEPAVSHGQVTHPESMQQDDDLGIVHDQAAHLKIGQEDSEPAVIHDHAIHPENSQQSNEPGIGHHQANDFEIDPPDNGLAINPDQATNLEVDSDEIDSAIGDMDPVSSTASLRSSVFDAIEENGRTYHRYKEGKYLLPNDDDEQDRLDLQHHLCLLCLNGRLHLAPTGENLQDVLDLGTGTGIWAIEFALQHPNANVIGSDLSPIQPNFVPTNCRFEVDDAEDEWTYSHKFDFIHWRLLFSCFKDPARVIANAFGHLKPGGYLETMDVVLPLLDVDDTLKDTALDKWCPMMIAGAAILGKDWTCTTKYQKYMEDAGFVDIQLIKYQWPTNPWAKSPEQKILGKWLQQNLLDGVGAMSTAVFTRGLKMSLAEVELFLLDVRKNIKDRKIHAFFPVYKVIGRKPG